MNVGYVTPFSIAPLRDPRLQCITPGAAPKASKLQRVRPDQRPRAALCYSACPLEKAPSLVGYSVHALNNTPGIAGGTAYVPWKKAPEEQLKLQGTPPDLKTTKSP